MASSKNEDYRRVRRVPLPAESGIAHLFKAADLADAYAIRLPPGMTRDIDTLTRLVLGNPAPWFRVLMTVRDMAMVPFGVKTSRQIRSEADAGGAEHIDFFPIYSRSEREMVVGENDRHLDFKASLLLRPSGSGTHIELVATTVARCHNRLGHAYLALISPFHRLIVRSSLSRAARRGWSS